MFSIKKTNHAIHFLATNAFGASNPIPSPTVSMADYNALMKLSPDCLSRIASRLAVEMHATTVEIVNTIVQRLYPIEV